MKYVLLIGAMLLGSAPACAETVYQLNRDQIAAIPAAPAPEAGGILVDPPIRDRQVHGEAGVAIGTGGYRSMYGSMVAPLGDTGYAAVSVETGQYGDLGGATGRSRRQILVGAFLRAIAACSLRRPKMIHRIAPFLAAVSLGTAALAQPALPDRPITRAEVVAAVKAKFALLDTNRDGVVTRAEFEAYREKMAAGAANEGSGAAAFVHIGGKWFDRADTRGDGRVTLAEATARPMEMFNMADTNGDGVVSVKERQLAMMLMSLK